jgi:hypothetical protein
VTQPLRQRVLASYHLGGLSREETHAYVEHRMRAVGWQGFPGWGDGALDIVHDQTGGIPRRINRLCSRILLGGALEQASLLTTEMAEATAEAVAAAAAESSRMRALLAAAVSATVGEVAAAAAAPPASPSPWRVMA